MAYTPYSKQGFQNNQILYAADLIEIEEAIIDTQNEDADQANRLTALETAAGKTQSGIPTVSSQISSAISSLDNGDTVSADNYVTSVNVVNGKIVLSKGTVTEFTGAASNMDGARGLVPAPEEGDENKFLKGNGTWAAIAGGVTSVNNQTGDVNLTASDISGTFQSSQIPDLAASKITSGTFSTSRIPDLDASKISSGTLNANRVPSLDASKIGSGTLDKARIPALWTTATAALDQTSWSQDLTQTVNVTGVTSSSTVIVSPLPSDREAYGEAGIACTAQGDGTLTFSADSQPSVSVTANIMIF